VGGAVAGNLDSSLAEERLAQIPGYVERFKDVYGNAYPLWDDAVKALAAYQRTIISQNVPLDAYLDGDESAISDAAKRGLELYNGKAGCLNCHNGPLASDDRFYGCYWLLSKLRASKCKSRYISRYASVFKCSEAPYSKGS